jgi:U32 family peptidase
MRTPDTHDVPELLAPAGGPDALKAAVRNGADAVYLGTGALNARRGAANFTTESLEEACRFAHLRGARIYLTANIVMLASEMEGALALIARAWEAGVDAVIVQDLGLLYALQRSLPEVRVHASTQIDAHNAASIAALADLGVARVTLARELSIDEIAGLVAGSAVEVESFVHGSLCFCHSGQCLMSSMIGGRSANRGLCAQPCRLPYELVDASGRVAETPGKYLLSPKDLAGIEMLPGLVKAGVASLKIEGRMKSPDYVAVVVSVYRAALDRVLSSPESFAVSPAENDRLAEAFSRGFTKGYLADVRDNELMSYGRPNNRGVPLGRVAAYREGVATIDLDRAVESEDTLEFWTASGRFAQAAGRVLLGGGEASAAPKGAHAGMRVDKPVRAGDRVFRVTNAALIQAARRSWQEGEERRPVPVRLEVRIRLGEPISLRAEADGVAATVQGAVVEAARTKAIGAPDVVEHVGRLGGTPYGDADISVELDAGVGLSFSTLHALRRDVLDRLDAARLAPWSGRRRVPDPRPPALAARAAAPARADLVVAAADSEAAVACLAAGADRALSADLRSALAPGVEPLLPRVAHDAEFATAVAAAGGRAVAGNLGVLRAAAAAGARVDADWGLNVVNAWSAAALAGLGAAAVWASPELSAADIAALCRYSQLPVGVVVGGRTELMIAEHCVLQASGPCSHLCASCARRKQEWVLRDRKGYEFPVSTDAAGRAHIYNSVPLDLSRAVDVLLAAGVSSLRLDLQSASREEAVALTRAWRGVLDTALNGGGAPSSALVEPSTSGHFFRGLT